MKQIAFWGVSAIAVCGLSWICWEPPHAASVARPNLANHNIVITHVVAVPVCGTLTQIRVVTNRDDLICLPTLPVRKGKASFNSKHR